MKYIEYNSEGNCIIRSFSKSYNTNSTDIYNELESIKEELNSNDSNDIEVFEEYMRRRNTNKIDKYKDIQVKDLVLDNNSYIVFCYDKKDWYHLIPIIDNTVYDKTNKCLDLYVISIYRKD